MAANRTKGHVSPNESGSGREKPVAELSAGERTPRPYGSPPKAGDDPKERTKDHPALEEDLPFLQRRAYEGRELTLAFRKNTEKSIFGRLTVQQLEQIVDLTEDCLTESSLLHFLYLYMEIIDNAFFFGAVRPILNGFVIYSEITSKAGFYHDKGRTIHMNSAFCARNRDYPQRRYLETLAHEMLHAFLHHYTCRCRRCGKRAGNASKLGISGHGFIWANAMIAIQKAMARDLKWEVDCNIEASAMNEMKASGWRPRHDQLVR